MLTLLYKYKTTFLAALVIIYLPACSSKFVAGDQMSGDAQSSRYSIAQDRAPTRVLSADQIEVPQPRKEPLSRGGNKSPYRVLGKTYHIMPSAKGYREEGFASWYGEKFHGHTTSNGEVFDMYQVSAAHKSLPLPTWVRVTNLDNNQSIYVRVNDRGPFHSGRIIDLSYAAAVKLGFHDKGTARVRVEALPDNELDTASYFVQVGAFSQQNSAQSLQRQLSDQVKDPVEIYQDTFYRVRIGPVTYDRAVQLQTELSSDAIGKPLIVADN
ncbi:septal ring lytic transglycosylase RlpA family protein [Reinekea thalattae]|uniref:Endolytic peptidoglycan transglycosylase RlpA n=1 Tax=Reinekea thalattae TaxID=2593301 RepID=A0A5C8ZAP0_9GAMM|nr:septal ring lytic transglycosylase RlpA family protein [Reinekea thalattae]TXR54248.1 septal ring lytic transglycosylase RlpA family protein [Reinekea thalattae]